MSESIVRCRWCGKGYRRGDGHACWHGDLRRCPRCGTVLHADGFCLACLKVVAPMQ